MKKRKILYVSGSRADYGLMRPVLFALKRHPELSLEIGATGMHLMPEFGETLKEIKKDKFKVHRIEAVYQRDDDKSTVDFLGNFILKLAGKIQAIKPDIILLLGDRAEMLGAAITGIYLKIPVAHIHGGEVTSTVDEITRQAVTKLAHIHLAANNDAARRIIKLGEDAWRVFTVGAPGLDSILKRPFSRKKISKKYKLNPLKPILLVLQHPVSSLIISPAEQMRQTMEALKELACQSVIIYPNADSGGREMIRVIEKYRKLPFIRIYKNIPHDDYLGLMKTAKVLIGNSSSGIIEAPAVHLPAVNVGKREDKRLRTDNLIAVDYKSGEIQKAIKKAIYDKKFRLKVGKCRSPYGQGKAADRIAHILSRMKINNRLLQKQITY